MQVPKFGKDNRIWVLAPEGMGGCFSTCLETTMGEFGLHVKNECAIALRILK